MARIRRPVIDVAKERLQPSYSRTRSARVYSPYGDLGFHVAVLEIEDGGFLVDLVFDHDNRHASVVLVSGTSTVVNCNP